MTRGKYFSVMTICLVLVLCLTLGLFTVFSDVNAVAVDFDINVSNDNSLALPTAAESRAGNVDLKDGEVYGGSLEYTERAYGVDSSDPNYNSVVVRISTADQLRKWLWKNPSQKSAILVNDISNFEWFSQSGWSKGFAPTVLSNPFEDSVIRSGVTLDGCGYKIIMEIGNSGNVSYPTAQSVHRLNETGLFVATLSGIVKNVNFDSSKPAHVIAGKEHTFNNADMTVGLLFGNIGQSGVVENVSLTHNASFKTTTNAKGGLFDPNYTMMHVGLIAGRSSGLIKQVTINATDNSRVNTSIGSNRMSSYSFSAYFVGMTLDGSQINNISLNMTNQPTVIKMEAYSGQTSVGLIAGRSKNGSVDGVIFQGRANLTKLSNSPYTSLLFGSFEKGEMNNFFSNAGELNIPLYAKNRTLFSYVYNDSSISVKYDKLSNNNGKLQNYKIALANPLKQGFVWSVEVSGSSGVSPYYTYEQYSKSIISVPLLPPTNASGDALNSGAGYKMITTVGSTGSATYGWDKSTDGFTYDQSEHKINLNVPSGWDLYDSKGDVKDNVSIKFKTSKVKNVATDVKAIMMPVATINNSGIGIMYIDKTNKRIMLDSQVSIDATLSDTITVKPAKVNITDSLFDKNKIVAKGYDGYKLIDKKLVSNLSVSSVNGISTIIDIIAADKYIELNGRVVLNTDYLFDIYGDYTGYKSADVGSTEGLILFNSDNNFLYVDSNGDALDNTYGIISYEAKLPPISVAEIKISWDDIGKQSYTGLKYSPRATSEISTYINKYVDKPYLKLTYTKDGEVFDSLQNVGTYNATLTTDNPNFVIKKGHESKTYVINEPIINITAENGMVEKTFIDGELTLVATPSDTYVFSHWTNGKGIILSQDATFVTNVTVSYNVIAVFVKSPESMINILFKSAAGNVIAKAIATTDVYLEDVKPIDPKREGFVFDGWYIGEEKLNNNSILSSDIELVAKFISSDKALINNISVKAIEGISYYINGEIVTDFVEVEIDSLVNISIGQTSLTFIHWVDANNNIVSYEMKYAFYSQNDINLRPVFDTDGFVQLDKRSTINASIIATSELHAKINGSYIVEETDTLLEYGMLVATGEFVSESMMNIDCKTTVKHVLNLSNEFGQFKTYYTAYEYGNHMFRPYMLVKDKDGNIKDVYGSISTFMFSTTVEDPAKFTIASMMNSSIATHADVERFGNVN